MDVEKLFNGIAVIVDNEIEKKSSAIYKIKELIEAKNIPVAVFSEIPQPGCNPGACQCFICNP